MFMQSPLPASDFIVSQLDGKFWRHHFEGREWKKRTDGRRFEWNVTLVPHLTAARKRLRIPPIPHPSLPNELSTLLEEVGMHGVTESFREFLTTNTARVFLANGKILTDTSSHQIENDECRT